MPLFVPTRRNARFLRAIDAIDAIDGAMRTAIRAHRDDPPARPDLLSMLLQAFSDAGVSPEEGDETRGPRRFLPFGAGPWACLGNHLSLLQGALVLARVAQRFELRRTGRPAPPVETTFAIRPRGGLPLPVERRRASRIG